MDSPRVFLTFTRPHSPNWFQRLIRWRTLGEFTHVALIFHRSDGTLELWEAREGGIRRTLVTSMTGEVVPVTCTQEQAELIRSWWLAHEGAPYDAVGLIELAAGKRSSRKEAWFCSEAATASLQQAGIFCFADPASVSPVSLWYMIRAREEVLHE